MADIFISYSSEDRARARMFADAFEAEGLSVWWDAGLRAGDAYDQKIEQALKSARAVVVLWSKTSVESRWVRAEATLADRARTLVPCMIEPCDRPIMFELTHTAELAHWQGDRSDKAWQAFLGDVKRFLASEAATVAEMASTAEPASVKETLKPGQSGSAPSLAVLPFTNRSGLAEDDVFAEGMVEDVISALSQGVNVRVLGATATANLSRAAITDLAALGRQLGVHYLLEGNVRRVGANLRVTTQLLEAATGEIVWTGKFDRPLSELAELQEELVTEIAACLDIQVYALEIERALKKPSDITAWEAVARSMAAYRDWGPASHERAIEEAARAVAIAPDYAPGLAAYAAALADQFLATGSDDRVEVQRIRSLAHRALALDPDNAQVLCWAGEALCFTGAPEEGERHTARAVRKAPGSGFLHLIHSSACMMLNRAEQALLHANTAERLMPGSHFMWAVKLCQARPLAARGNWPEARSAAAAALDIDPMNFEGLILSALCSLQLGLEADARTYIQSLYQLKTKLSVVESYVRQLLPDGADADRSVASIHALYAAIA